MNRWAGSTARRRYRPWDGGVSEKRWVQLKSSAWMSSQGRIDLKAKSLGLAVDEAFWAMQGVGQDQASGAGLQAGIDCSRLGPAQPVTPPERASGAGVNVRRRRQRCSL